MTGEVIDPVAPTPAIGTKPATAAGPARVHDWDFRWAQRFTSEADRLRRTLGITGRGGAIDIQHIGGTAVTGLAGTDVIDILVITPDLATLDSRRPLLNQLGYVSLGDGGVSSQRKLRLGAAQAPKVTLYIYQPGNKTALHHLLVRDFLRTHADERKRYGTLKLQLAQRYPDNVKAYENGKRPRLTRLLERATGRR